MVAGDREGVKELAGTMGPAIRPGVSVTQLPLLLSPVVSLGRQGGFVVPDVASRDWGFAWLQRPMLAWLWTVFNPIPRSIHRSQNLDRRAPV